MRGDGTDRASVIARLEQAIVWLGGVSLSHRQHNPQERRLDALAAMREATALLSSPEAAAPNLQTLRATFTNDVIRAVEALAHQENVCREQAGQAVFVTGTDAAREYIVEHVRASLTSAQTPQEAK